MRSQEFTTEEARKIGDRMSVDWGKYDLEEFRIGLFVELEDAMDDPATDMTDEEMRSTARIVLGHLDEQADYYTEKYHMFAESADATF
jgi:Protein of unknown function (DUF5661)